jgi:hypothetical protein
MSEDDADAPEDADAADAPETDADEAAGNGDDEETAVETHTVESLQERLDAVQAALDDAETESDLDDVAADVDALETDLEDADLPEPDEDEEDADDPAAELEDAIEDVREDLEDARGPYAEDVVADVEGVSETIADTRWTEDGHDSVLDAVDSFTDAVSETLDASIARDGDDTEDATSALADATDAIESASLDPDADADTIQSLVDAADALATGIDDAEEWDDLTIRQQLDYHGVYDQLDHRKDFPPEWNALKVYEKNFDAEGVLVVLDRMDSDFMERHCLEVLEKLGPEEALDEMSQRASRRDKPAIRILGKIASEEPVDTLVEYVDADSDPELQKATLRALGEIGSEDATQPIANKLVAESEDTRSRAARALGLIGDTRAINPLSDVLADDDEADRVRASAAWGLNQIGTERALDALADYTDDRAYIVQAEAEKAV